MKIGKSLLGVCVVALGTGSAYAQDPVKVDSAHYKTVFENAAVRVLKITYPQGSKSTMHQHPDSIVVPLTAAKVQFTLPDGKTENSDMAVEAAMYSPAGTHNPANVGTKAMEALLVEFKTAAPGTATLPASRENMATRSWRKVPARRRTARPRLQAFRSRRAPSMTTIRWSSHSGRAGCPWQSTASRQKQRGHAAMCNSSVAAFLTKRKTPATRRWTW